MKVSTHAIKISVEEMHSIIGIHDVHVDHNFSVNERKVNFSQISDTVQLVQAIITIIANLLVFVLIASHAKLRKKLSYQIFMHLQLTHVLLSLLVVVSELFASTWHQFYHLVVMGNTVLVEMFISLIVYSADRLLAINFPLKHKLVTSSHVITTLVCSWLLPILFCVLSLSFHIRQLWMTIVMEVMIGSAACVLAVTNLLVYVTATKHDRFIRDMNTARSPYSGKMLRTSYVCLAIVSSFLICWLPYFVHNILALLDVYRPQSLKAFTIVAEQLALLNGLLDPVLFVLLAQDARLAIFDFCHSRGKNPEKEERVLRLGNDC